MRRPRARGVCAAAAAWLVAIAAQAQPATAQDPQGGVPSATITFRGRTATLGVGFSWGASTVEFQGQTYPVRVDGFVLGGLGYASGDGVGQVYGLTKIEDLNGDYTALATGGAFGQGAGTLVMRNDKGVRIVMDTTTSGFQVGLGPRGITLEVGEAGGPPASTTARLPQTLAFGEIKAGPLFLRPTLNAQIFFLASHNAGFDGQWSFGPVDDVDYYWEHSNEVGLNLRYPVGAEGKYGSLRGRVSGVFSLTTSGPDGPVCNGNENTTSEYTFESGYLAWQSGNLFPDLGFNAVELSGGNQNYQVFDGLLFWDGGQDCGGRGGNWLSARKAFEETGLLRVQIRNALFEAVHLKYNDHPDTGTRLAGARIEYVTDDLWLEHLKLGVMYFNIYGSEVATRNGMEGVYVYHEATPLPFLTDLTYKASFVRESNSQSSGLTSAYAWYVAPAYQISQLPWTPQISYRFAYFSGGTNHAFDSLFTGLPDWGSWFQGELLGETVLSNSNLTSHQVRLTLAPHEKLKLNLIYYKFLLDDKDQAFGLAPARVEHALADEVDIIADIALTNWWSITTTLGIAVPDKGFRQAVNGGATWINGYVYMNFNF
jgi:hypothetical protein